MSMNAENSTSDFTRDGSFHPVAERAQEGLQTILQAANRQKKSIGISVAVCFALGIGYLALAVPRYTATASLLIDAKQVGMTATSAFEGALAFDTGAVDSQVLVLMSDKLAGAVVDRLQLTTNLGFVNPPRSVFGATFSWVSNQVDGALRWLGIADPTPRYEDLPPELQKLVVVEQLKYYLKVTRNARTYVLTIEYTDADRMLARTIASTYASSYLEEQLESKFDATRRASLWLDDRIREVKAKANAADQAVQAFRARNNLTEASGRLISEQNLTDANTQLAVAKNDLASAQAKYERLKQIVDAKEYTAAVVDSLTNPNIAQLRSKYLLSAKQNADITAKLGPQHLQAQNARQEMLQYEHLIFEEIVRLLQSYQSDVQIAADRVANFERSIERMRTANLADSDAMAKLRALEQEATTYNTLYAGYLQKAQDMLQQQSFPITDARIITEAAIPLLPSSPKKLLVLLGSLFLGGLVGGGVAALREFRERGFRTSTQVREELGLDFIAYVPELPKDTFKLHPEAHAEGKGSRSARVVRPANPGLEVVLDDPLSRYAESMRALKIATDFRFGVKRPLVLGFVSMFPNEGKSTAAKNYASLIAAQGERVLLVDGDLRNPQLTRDLTPQATLGFVDLLQSKEKALSDVVHIEERSKLVFLPGATHKRIAASSDALGSQAMIDLVQKAATAFDLIIIDLPPIGAVIDAVAASRFIDGYYLVVEWGKTPRSAVRDMLIA
ncbi:chromosome partitioning protein ParA, partial [Siculibacillus lacustris]